MSVRTDFPYGTAREDVRIPMPDGIPLYARIWRPVTPEPVPALLEYAPHRLTDRTAPRDARRHPWYAGHGYASVRVDVRGHGCSGGVPGGPYAPYARGGDGPEAADGVAVVRWLAAQPWCTGAVGMFGMSWAGALALRIASLAPDALRAVVAVCAADDGFGGAAPYLGGSVVAADGHAGSAALLALAARPPDPRYAGGDWREQWLTRLDALEPPSRTWLAHQTRDAHWAHGGLCEDPAAVRAGVLAVGGLHDPYRDTVLRLVSRLPAGRVRGLLGPWPHAYPDRGLPPGPAIGFLQETLRWWDHWLRGAANGVMDEPLLRAWICAARPPATAYGELPGRWAGESAWPPPGVAPVTYALRGEPVEVASPQHTGLDAGRFVPRGDDADLPPDQREEDAKSACFEFPVAAGEPVEVLGRPRVTLRLRMDVPHGQVAARLCDVAPDGSSTLVTRGALNLSARLGPEKAVPWPAGAYEDVVFDLGAAAYAFPPGHRIRLALSSAYWPWLWPRAGSEAGWTLDPAGSALVLPVRGPAPPADAGVGFAPPEQAPPLGAVVPETLDPPRPPRRVVRDVAAGTWRLQAAPRPEWRRIHPDGLEYAEDADEEYGIRDGDALSARVRCTWRIRLHRPDLGWDTVVEARSETSCDAEDFHTEDELLCREGGEAVFHRTWRRSHPRTAG
ncbi:CocE/NonD family hydrolase [Streptomyces globosus]|uniref:CocE/NonD family hydrolase n=1 Tax=Streptomyces globosus TaxID=68209 RepID=UPI00362AD534